MLVYLTKSDNVMSPNRPKHLQLIKIIFLKIWKKKFENRINKKKDMAKSVHFHLSHLLWPDYNENPFYRLDHIFGSNSFIICSIFEFFFKFLGGKALFHDLISHGRQRLEPYNREISEQHCILTKLWKSYPVSNIGAKSGVSATKSGGRNTAQKKVKNQETPVKTGELRKALGACQSGSALMFL